MPQKGNVIKLKNVQKTRLITGPIKVIRINKDYKNVNKICSNSSNNIKFERKKLTKQLQNHKMLFEVNKNKISSNRENQLKSYFPALKPLLQVEKKTKVETPGSIFTKPKIIRKGEYIPEPIKSVPFLPYKPRSNASHKTKIIFMSNSRTSQPRTRRRNKPKKNQKKEEEEEGVPDVNFDVENDKLTAAWHSLVASVHLNSDQGQFADDDFRCFEFSVDTTRRKELDLKPFVSPSSSSSNTKTASRPASG